MKRTQSDEVLPRFFQRDVLRHLSDEVAFPSDSLENVVFKRSLIHGKRQINRPAGTDANRSYDFKEPEWARLGLNEQFLDHLTHRVSVNAAEDTGS